MLSPLLVVACLLTLTTSNPTPPPPKRICPARTFEAGEAACESCEALQPPCEDCICSDFVPTVQAACTAACLSDGNGDSFALSGTISSLSRGDHWRTMGGSVIGTQLVAAPRNYNKVIVLNATSPALHQALHPHRPVPLPHSFDSQDGFLGGVERV